MPKGRSIADGGLKVRPADGVEPQSTWLLVELDLQCVPGAVNPFLAPAGIHCHALAWQILTNWELGHAYMRWTTLVKVVQSGRWL